MDRPGFFSSLRRLGRAVPTLAGAGAGYLYYFFVGCASGTCPISSNPLISTLYGGVIGWLLGTAFAPARKTQLQVEEDSHA